MKVNKSLIKLAIICLSLTDVGVGATTPALATIAAAFPTISPAMIQWIASVPALTLAFVPAVLYAPLARALKKRTIMYIGVIFFLIGGVGPAFLHSSFTIILALRLLLGLGIGLLTPMALDLIYDFFEGHEQRTMIGWNGAAMSAGGLVFQTLGGILCQIRWDYTFYAYFAAAIFFAISIAFLPEPEKKAVQVETGAPKTKHKITVSALLYVLLIFFNGMFFYVPITNTAFILIGERIAQPSQIGMMFNALTLSSIIFGIFFGQLFKAFKYHLLTFGAICGAVGLFLGYTGHSITMFVASLFLTGVTLGFSTSAVWAKFGDLVHPTLIPLAISFGISAMNLGEFCQPLIFNLFTVPGRTPFLYGCIGFIALAVYTIILGIATSSKNGTNIQKAD